MALVEIHHRLVVKLELAVIERFAQREFERAPVLHARIHLSLEEAIDAAAIGLGAVKRHVGILQKLVGLGAVGRRESDADTGIDHDLLAAEIVGRPDRLGDAASQMLGIGGGGDVGLDDGKLVAADTGNSVLLTDAATQPLGDRTQQLVADRMAE